MAFDPTCYNIANLVVGVLGIIFGIIDLISDYKKGKTVNVVVGVICIIGGIILIVLGLVGLAM